MPNETVEFLVGAKKNIGNLESFGRLLISNVLTYAINVASDKGKKQTGTEGTIVFNAKITISSIFDRPKYNETCIFIEDPLNRKPPRQICFSLPLLKKLT